jgi:hypothetical protein
MSRDERELQEALSTRYYADMHAGKKRGRIHSVVDLGEAAVRLGSPVTFDRRGDVCFIDGFEDGIHKWNSPPPILATGRTLYSCSSVGRTGSRSARMGAGRVPASNANLMHRYMPLAAGGFWTRLGLEFSFTYDSYAQYITAQILTAKGPAGGNSQAYYMVRYNLTTKALQYFDTSGAWTNVATIDSYDFPVFNTFKLVIDAVKNKFERILFNEQEINVSDLLPTMSVSASPAFWRVELGISSQTGLTSAVWFDDVIFTQNEPRNA